jgi:hypothetical protein
MPCTAAEGLMRLCIQAHSIEPLRSAIRDLCALPIEGRQRPRDRPLPVPSRSTALDPRETYEHVSLNGRNAVNCGPTIEPVGRQCLPRRSIRGWHAERQQRGRHRPFTDRSRSTGPAPIADGRSSKLGTAKLSLATAELKRQFVFSVQSKSRSPTGPHAACSRPPSRHSAWSREMGCDPILAIECYQCLH